ncbi:MAG TPA: DUF1573 domain-containing protein [Gemmataceae bacterium]|nr:DUF1573 domain-containing protein [Gemmataceae bacterium]
MLRYSLVLGAGLCLAAPVGAGSWADAMFTELSKDFGSVPHGPTVAHLFRMTNNTGNPVHISGVRVSCGCVTASAGDTSLAPGQSTAIQAYMDTSRFYGSKGVTIYVSFDQPRWEEVRLWVQANSRNDLMLSSQTFTLGQAKRGSMPSASLNVTFTGNGQWQITEVERESNYILLAVKELRRDSAEVTYQVTAAIRADAPVGKWYSDVWLKTNNPTLPKLRVPLTVEIEPALSISPALVDLGPTHPGNEEERKVIVRGIKPFRITKVEGTDDQLVVRDNTTESKAVHVLTVTLKPKKPGDLERTLKVLTDLTEEKEVEFQAKAQIVAGSAPR